MYSWTKYILLAFLLSTTTVFAQSKEELQNKKEKIADEIKLTSELLEVAKREKNSSINVLSTLKRKMGARDEMILTLGVEMSIYQNSIAKLEVEIQETDSSIVFQQEELNRLKSEYALMIQHAYSNRGAYDRLAFVFASQSVHQAYKRLKYLQQYSQYREKQAAEISALELQLEEELLKLKQQKALLSVERNKKSRVLQAAKVEKEQLIVEESAQQELVHSLQKKEKKLKQDLQIKEQMAKELDEKIRLIIAEEIRKAREAAKTTGTPSYSMTPEQQQLADAFSSNKSQLPWPVERGVITESYGRQKHPVLAGIETFNNGVKITTERGAMARAIFKGTVSRIISIPGAGKAIILNHGDYFSVYSNLSDVLVKVGQAVKTKQEMGVVLTNTSSKETTTELQIWKGDQKLDPAQWLYRAY